MVDYQTISIVLTGIGMIIALTYYTITLRNANRTRQKELLLERNKIGLEYIRSWADVVFVQDWKNLAELQEKYPWDTHFEERARVLYILNVYNSLGLLLKEKVTEPHLMFKMFPPPAVISTWKKYEAWIQEVRELSNDPQEYDGFEFLYNEVRRLYPNVNPIKMAKL